MVVKTCAFYPESKRLPVNSADGFERNGGKPEQYPVQVGGGCCQAFQSESGVKYRGALLQVGDGYRGGV